MLSVPDIAAEDIVTNLPCASGSPRVSVVLPPEVTRPASDSVSDDSLKSVLAFLANQGNLARLSALENTSESSTSGSSFVCADAMSGATSTVVQGSDVVPVSGLPLTSLPVFQQLPAATGLHLTSCAKGGSY